MIDVAKYVVPHWESFTDVSISNTRPENRNIGAAWKEQCQCYLMVSIMIRSYIMIMILGRLLRMNMSAIKPTTDTNKYWPKHHHEFR